MRFLFFTISSVAAVLSFIIVALTVLSILSGGGNLLFPGLGLVVSLPFIIALLVIFDAALIALALLVRRLSFRKLD